MKKLFLLLLAVASMAVAAHGQGVIRQEQIIQWRFGKPAGNPPVGYVYMYFDTTTHNLTCLNSSGSTAACSTLPSTSTANLCLLSTGVGTGSSWGSCSGATSANWSSLVPGTGTITTGTFNVGTGTTMTTTGSGVINANQLSGATFAAPSAIGSGTPNTGAFTTLSATSTVSGAGITALFASPPAIGGTVAAAGTFTTATITTLNATTINGAALSGTFTGAPTLSGNVAFTGTPTFSNLPTFPSCTANFFLASPNGSSGAPTCRAVVAADIPTLNQNTTGTASNVTGTVALINGGTGTAAGSKAAAFDAIAPTTTEGDLIMYTGGTNARLAVGSNGQCLTSNGTGPVWGTCATGSIGGTGTTNTVAVFTAAATIGNSLLTDNATTLAYSGTGGLNLSAGPLGLTEISIPTGIAGRSLLYATAAHRILVKNNGAATGVQLVQAGSDISVTDQVISTHLTAPLPTAQGGTARNSTATFPSSGIVSISGTCTNQVITATSGTGPTCTTVTSAYVDTSIALTGTDINTSNQVTATHLAAALPINQGGTGTISTLTGLVRGNASAMTAAELSQDVTTSGSNVATVVGLRTLALPTLTASTGLLFDTAGVLSLPATLPASAMPALTGDVTNTAGSLTTTVSKINGATYTGTAGDLVKFATSTTPGDSNVVAADVITYHTPVAGILRSSSGTQAVAATELSGDATTLNSNVVTVININGNSVPAGALANQTLVATATSTLSWQTIPNCVGGSNALNYTQSSTTFSCLTITTLVNPMTTLGDIIYGGSAGTPTRLAGPTTGNSPYALISLPSSSLATPPAWVLAGVPVDSESGATFTIQSDNQTNPDRGKLVLTTNNTTSTAVTVPQAGSSGFGSFYSFAHINTGSVIATDTPTTSTINNNNAPVKLVGCVSGHNCEGFIWYSDANGSTGNYWGLEVLPTDANGRLAAEGFGALTGDATTTAGSYTVTVSAINGTAFSGTSTHLVAFGTAGLIPSDSGIVDTNVVTASSNFTSGDVIQAAANNKTTIDSGIVANQIVTAGSTYSNGGLVYSNGTARTTVNSADWSIQTHALTGGSSGVFTTADNPALSSSAVNLTGTVITGGTATTTWPYMYFFMGASNVSSWSTNGTFIGFNPVTGFTGNIIDVHAPNGGASVFKVDYQGNVTVNACSGCGSVSLALPLTVSGTVTSGAIPYFNSTTQMSSSALLAANAIVVGGGAGTAPSTDASATLSTGTLSLGASGTLGAVVMGNATSGTLTLEPATGAITSYTIQLPVAQPTSGNTFLSCTAASPAVCTWVSGGAVTSVSNSDGTLTISPTTGAVVASIALGHANTWTATQTFGTSISIGGVTAAGATGTGNVVFATSPTLTTPALGTPSSATLTNATGLPLNGVVSATGAITTLANGNNPLTMNWAQTTNTQTAFSIGETTAATGTTDVEVAISTLAGSTALPLSVSGSLTGSQTLATVSITPTWNTTGVVDAALLINPTNTASGTGSFLVDAQLGGVSKFTVDKSGNISIASGANYGGTSNSSLLVFCGGIASSCTGAVTSLAGSAQFQGSDNSSTSSAAKAGYAIFRGGELSAATPNAAALEGVTQVGAGYLKGSAIAAVGDVVCMSTTAYTVTDCPHTTPNANIVGVATSTANPIGVVAYGTALVKLDGAVTAIGDNVCMSTTADGQGHDNGSATTACTLGTAIGVIIADSGTITQMSGTSTAATAMSTTLVLVQLHISQ